MPHLFWSSVHDKRRGSIHVCEEFFPDDPVRGQPKDRVQLSLPEDGRTAITVSQLYRPVGLRNGPTIVDVRIDEDYYVSALAAGLSATGLLQFSSGRGFTNKEGGRGLNLFDTISVKSMAPGWPNSLTVSTSQGEYWLRL